MTTTAFSTPPYRPPPEPCSRCRRRHRSYRAVAKCRWAGAEWITGDARYASVSYCPRGTTIVLFDTLDDARRAKAAIDKGGCGGMCYGPPGHYIRDLAAGAVSARAA